jgi:predicted alpha/beta-fold hydrolase
VQSLLAGWPARQRLVRRRARPLVIAARPELVDCRDGVRLLGYHSPAPVAARGLVVLLHGWEGSAEASYVLSIGAHLHGAGYDVFRLNFRDHGDTHALNRDLFHSCRIEEVANAVARIVELHGGERNFLAGYSLGGNFALRVAVRAPSAAMRLNKVVAVCPVLRPRSTMRALEEGLWVYREYFLRRWRQSLRAKAACFPELYDFRALRELPTLTATTEFLVTRYAGFADLGSYLDGYAVTGNALHDLRVPTRLIAAADDPVIPISDLDDVARSPALTVSVLPHGGHCGFLEGYRLRSWLDRAVLAEIDGS